MLDVHAPHERIHGFRDFLLHLLTITAGLLIALGLEAGVEAVHHRHQRAEAETKIREEIRKNQKSLEDGTPLLLAERAAMTDFIGILRDTAQGRETDGHVKLEFHEEEIPDAAWRTANSTGVMEYLPYEEVESFADAYREQALLQIMAQKALEDYLELTPAMRDDKSKMTKEEAVALLPIALRTLGHLNGVAATGAGTLASYKSALE